MTSRFEHDLYERDDDLSHCKICGGAEGSLPTLCPGRRMTAEESDAVYAGELNFASGPMTGAHWWTAVKEPMIVERANAARYEKLRRWMSSNVKEGWEEVERMGALASWESWDAMDGYLDALPVCNVGLCEVRNDGDVAHHGIGDEK